DICPEGTARAICWDFLTDAAQLWWEACCLRAVPPAARKALEILRPTLPLRSPHSACGFVPFDLLLSFPVLLSVGRTAHSVFSYLPVFFDTLTRYATGLRPFSRNPVDGESVCDGRTVSLVMYGVRRSIKMFMPAFCSSLVRSSSYSPQRMTHRQ